MVWGQGPGHCHRGGVKHEFCHLPAGDCGVLSVPVLWPPMGPRSACALVMFERIHMKGAVIGPTEKVTPRVNWLALLRGPG